VTIAKRASASSFTKMEISTRECGLSTSDTAKALTGKTRATNSAENTLAIGMKTKSMEEVLSSTKTEIVTTATG